MRFLRCVCLIVVLSAVNLPAQLIAQSSTTSSSSAKGEKKSLPAGDSGIDAGTVVNGVYSNKTLGLSCKIPEGWVLRTEEMNAADEEHRAGNDSRAAPDRTAEGGCPHTCNKALLAAFSRPPEARGEDVNSSILIAAESQDIYPGLKEAAQYFGPLTEVAKAQGFTQDEEPYGIALGSKVVVRGDFHKDVGTRVMRQSTLAFLSHGYAISITVIGGTEDEVDELIERIGFGVGKPAGR